MTSLLAVAFRNLLRAKRRNLLTGGTMALGSAALVLGSGLTAGIERQLTSNLIATQTGHLQVVARPHDFVPQNSPFDAYGQDLVPDAVGLARRIEEAGGAAGVVRAVPYLYGRGTALAGHRSSLASVIGVLPEREPELRRAHPPQQGSFLPADDPLAAYVAAPLAGKLRLAPGDTLSFVVQTPEGAVNSVDGIVCGVFAKGAPWFDNAVYVPLALAQSLYGWEGGGTNVKVTLAQGSPRAARAARPAVQALVAAAGPAPATGTAVRVETYDEAGRFSFAIVQANGTALFILSSFLFAAAAVGVVNGMLMSVHERTREIGTVRALGMRRRAVIRLFLLEGLALGLVAAAVGITAGSAFVLHLGREGIPMNTMTLAWMAGGDRLVPVLRAASVATAGAAIAALSVLAAVYPAWTASRLQPREALHHV
jgi:putative ABC transport system permease protein